MVPIAPPGMVKDEPGTPLDGDERQGSQSVEERERFRIAGDEEMLPVVHFGSG